jgi:hypothetical protein
MSQSRLGVVRWHFLLLAPIFLLLVIVPAAQAAPGWVSPQRVSKAPPPDTNAFDADIDVSNTGKATAAWIQGDGSQDRVFVADKQAGGVTFSTPVPISPAGSSAFEPDIDVNAGGDAIVIWTRTGDLSILASFRPNGGSFDTPQLISTLPGSFHPRVDMDDQGNVQVVWTRQTDAGPPAKNVIEATTKPPFGAFTPPEVLSDAAWNNDDATVAAEPNSNGNAVATWTRFDPVVPAVQKSIVQTSSRFEINYPRPGGGTPLRVPLVPEFKACTTPDSLHTAPLAFSSCSNVQMQSTQLTQGTTGAGTGFAKLEVFCNGGGAGEQPPCSTTAGDQEDVRVTTQLQDVRCAVGGITGCTLVGDDYVSRVIFNSAIRLTDLSNGLFQDDPATLQDSEISVAPTCVATASVTAGSNCNVSTTLDTLLPNYVKERKRAIVSYFSQVVKDQGPDNSVTPPAPPAGLSCPPICGSGDEKVYARQGVFLP